MAAPLEDIELQLKRARFENTVNDARKKLNADFDLLSMGDAQKVLTRILDPNDELAKSFLRLHHAIRIELMTKLPKLLGHMKSEDFYEHLTKTSQLSAVDKNWQAGLRQLFPDKIKGLRDKFLKSLNDQFSSQHTRPAGSDATLPGVTLEFRNYGWLSWDNKANARSKVPGGRLGPGQSSGKNFMEIRGNVIGHRTGVEYDFKRAAEDARWYRLGGNTWRRWDPREGQKPDDGIFDDDEHNGDEYLFPDHNHIYVFDSPGLIRVGPPEPNSLDPQYGEITEAIRNNNLTAYVWIMKATEWVEIRSGPTSPWVRGESLQWYTVTWLEKPKDGPWRRTPELNYIKQGTLDSLKGQEPPIP